MMSCLCLCQRWTPCVSCSTRSSSCSASWATCWSSWSWCWTSACAPSPTPSCCHWRSATWWWPSSACLSPSFPTSWRTSSSELPCARSSPTLWVRMKGIGNTAQNLFSCFPLFSDFRSACSFTLNTQVYIWITICSGCSVRLCPHKCGYFFTALSNFYLLCEQIRADCFLLTSYN